jgi:hypothetical protein
MTIHSSQICGKQNLRPDFGLVFWAPDFGQHVESKLIEFFVRICHGNGDWVDSLQPKNIGAENRSKIRNQGDEKTV